MGIFIFLRLYQCPASTDIDLLQILGQIINPLSIFSAGQKDSGPKSTSGHKEKYNRKKHCIQREIILENSPEAEPQLLAALKDYYSLTEQELRDNDYLEKYGYRADDFCYDFPLDTVLFPILFFLVTVL